MPELTPEWVGELRRIAEAAQFLLGLGTPYETVMPKFHATFDPPTVLALLDEIERLRKAAIDPGEYGIGEPVVDWNRTAELRAQEIERLRREREAAQPGGLERERGA